jgi:hypothetical protein
MNRQTNRRALRMIGLAALAGLGVYHNTADDKGGGGGAGDPPPADDKGKKGAKEPEKKQPEKVELTADELERKISEAKAAAKADFDAEREKEKKAREEEDARKKGEFEKLYQAETGRVKELERDLATSRLEARKKDVAIRLNRHLAADHKDYIENDVDILPHVAFDADTKDDDIDKRIKEAAAAFVKRTPKASALSGAPAGAARGKLPAGTVIPENDRDDQRRATRPVGPAARF